MLSFQQKISSLFANINIYPYNTFKMEIKRKYHIDVLRILACFAVIFNHFDPGFFIFSQKQHGTIAYWILLALSVFCKFAVPIFFMITGALLLKKDESISTLYKKRVRKIALVLLVTSLVYYFFEKYAIHNVNLGISAIYTGETEYHLWYLYSYLALLMSLPFLRSIAKDLTKNKIIYLFVLYITIRYFIPLIQLLLFSNNYRMNGYISGIFTCADIFFLPLMGYFIENKLNKKLSRNKLLAIWGSNILSLILSIYATNLANNTPTASVNQSYISLFSSTNAMAIYLTIKNVDFNKISNKILKALLHLSSCTFGIYLVHLLFMRIVITSTRIEFYYELSTIMQIACWLAISLLIMTISYLIIALAKKMPVLKKYI